jgi:hypothetical protein
MLPITAWAAEKPSMTAMWMELIFMMLMLIVLKVVDFSNQKKFILFVAYILVDIATQTLWFALLVFMGLYVFFKKKAD